jgi:hypothetical protein
MAGRIHVATGRCSDCHSRRGTARAARENCPISTDDSVLHAALASDPGYRFDKSFTSS